MLRWHFLAAPKPLWPRWHHARRRGKWRFERRLHALTAADHMTQETSACCRLKVCVQVLEVAAQGPVSCAAAELREAELVGVGASLA